MNKFSLILATDIFGGIGRQQCLPWHIPCDLNNFKKKTIGGVVVMGRRTWESIGETPLPNRQNIVISQTFEGGVQDMLSLIRMRNECMSEKEWFIIGGGTLYDWFLERPHLIKTIHWTRLNADYECDVFVDLNRIMCSPTFNQINSNTTMMMNKQLGNRGEYFEYRSTINGK